MEEIKFRGLDLMSGEWVHGSHLKTGMGVEYIVPQNVIANHLPQYAVDKETVGQFTGLKDKNGVEIYLGDIAKREFDIWKTDYDHEGSPNGDECIDEGYFIGVVSQTPSGLYVLNKCRKYDVDGNLIKKCSGIKLFSHRSEIIGNIYDNPNLLESDDS